MPRVAVASNHATKAAPAGPESPDFGSGPV